MQLGFSLAGTSGPYGMDAALLGHVQAGFSATVAGDSTCR